MRAGSRAALQRAVAHAGAGRLASARGEVRDALASDGEDGVVQLTAAHVLHVARDHQGGLAALARARSVLPTEAPRILRRAIACAQGLGWEREVAALCAEGRRVAARDAAWDALELAMHRRGGDDGAALEAAERALLLAPRWPALQLERAGILARLGRDEAVAATRAAVAMVPEDLAYRREGARVLLDAGDFVGAAELWPEGRAELCLRSGDDAGARAWIGRMDGAAGLRAAGALDMSLGTWSGALGRFDAALAIADDEVTRLWRAEALLRLGRDAEAEAALTAAGAGGRADNFVGGMLRLLLLARRQPGAIVRAPQVEAFAGALAEMGLVVAIGGTMVEAAVVVEAALRRMRGSREPPLSRVDEAVSGDRCGDIGGLARLRGFRSHGPRYAARAVLGTIRGAEAGRVLARMGEVIAAYPTSALPVCHRGELRLWLGDVAGGEADLDAALAIEARTRWAYIGRTMAALLRGDPAAALAEDTRGVAVMGGEGPAVHVHRGEALRRLGRSDAAIAELRRAVGLHPGRVGAWVNLGLAYADGGDAVAMDGVFERLRTRCPGLVSDAARACGAVAWPDAGQPVGMAVQVAVLTQVLEMSRGNRSSSLVTYFTPEGQLRAAADAPAGEGPHAGDVRDLARAAALVGGRR